MIVRVFIEIPKWSFGFIYKFKKEAWRFIKNSIRTPHDFINETIEQIRLYYTEIGLFKE